MEEKLRFKFKIEQPFAFNYTQKSQSVKKEGKLRRKLEKLNAM